MVKSEMGAILRKIPEEEIVLRLRALSQREVSVPAGVVLRPAAVLVPLLWQDDEWHLLFTRRTDTVQTHKGQVSFPGGAVDPGDLTPEDTALREAHEEIGLVSEAVTLLGRLPWMVTVSSFLVTPVVARIHRPCEFKLSVDEVSRLFTIPLAWLADSSHWEERPRINRLGQEEKVVYFEPFDGEILWGITGRITVELIKYLLNVSSG